MKKTLSLLLTLLLIFGMLAVVPVHAEDYSVDERPEKDDPASSPYEFNGHVYQVYDVNINCIAAKMLCENRGGYLACVTSAEEQAFLADLLETTTYLENDYFIGGTDDEEEGVWRWMNGEDWDFTAWYPGGEVGSAEPNNGLGLGEDYLIMSRPRKWLWVDVYGPYDNFSAQGGYVCEWDSYDAYLANIDAASDIEYFWYAKGGTNQICVGETKEFLVRRSDENGEVQEYFLEMLTWESDNSDVITVVDCDEFFARVRLLALQPGESNVSLFAGGTPVYTFRVSAVEPPAAVKILGDVDGDGKVTVIDATFIQRKLAGLANESFDESAADADEDGSVTVVDATCIQRKLAGLPTNENIGRLIA